MGIHFFVYFKHTYNLLLTAILMRLLIDIALHLNQFSRTICFIWNFYLFFLSVLLVLTTTDLISAYQTEQRE